jgi:predicted ArsR family transcriptional regulator
MASKTARILAVADALSQFTAPELAAYLGANRRTVNKVLLSRPDLFERQGNSPNLRGRPTNIWRVIDKEKTK